MTEIAEKTSFLDARLLQVEADAAAELHARFQSKIAGLVDAALTLAGAEKTESLTEAATQYALACSRTRSKMAAKDIAAEIAKGEAALVQSAKTLLSRQQQLDYNVREQLHRLQASGRLQPKVNPAAKPVPKTLGEAFNAVVSKLFAKPVPAPKGAPMPAHVNDLPWDENDRIYFKLDDRSQSPVEPLVAAYLQERGFTITDYAAGRAADNRKNEWKIGKIIKDNDGLLNAYFNDPARQSKNLMVVITRNMNDIARGSVERGWQSCRADLGSAARYAVDEANLGAMSAYLVTADDPDIHNPLARINIKPYDLVTSGHGDYYSARVKKDVTIHAPFNPIGLHHPGFADAVERWVEDNCNQNKPAGQYMLRAGCESYREFKFRDRLPQDAAAALRALKIDYARDETGRLIVRGDLNLSGRGLTRLPDFSDTLVIGSIDLSGNRLMTLEGLPQTSPATRKIDVRGNLLICFAGAAAAKAELFDYRDNAWLMTALGAPEAQKYRFGNDNDGGGKNHAFSKAPVCPTQKPERFPGFKRA